VSRHNHDLKEVDMKNQTQKMNWRDFKRSCLLASALVIALCALIVPAAMASSSSADLSVAVVANLPAGVNAGQSAPANLNPGCITLAIGNASAACDPPTSALIIAAGKSTLTFTAGTASTTAGPPNGFAFANSFGTSITERFTNTNAFAVLVPLGIGYVPDLEVTAGPGESSDAAFAFAIGGLGQGVQLGASKDLPCNACGADSYNPGALGASF